MSELKVCSRCEKELPMTKEHFRVNKKIKCGFHSMCKPCVSEYNKQWRKDNIKHVKKHYQENRERLIEYQKDHHKKNHKKYLKYQREWNKRNPDYHKEYFLYNKTESENDTNAVC